MSLEPPAPDDDAQEPAPSPPGTEPCPLCGELAERLEGRCTACGERLEREAPAGPLCPACGEAAGQEEGRCRGCGELSEEARQGEPRLLRDRALAVLLRPEHAFAFHRASWGWARPWLVATALGLLLGVVTLVRVDLGAVMRRQFERSVERMPPAQRAMMEGQAETVGRLQGFLAKAQLLVGPPLGGLLQLFAYGAVVFLGARLLGGPHTPSDLLRCLSLVAWAGLADGVRYLAAGVGVLAGNAMPMTSPAGLVDPLEHVVLHTALSRLDPTVVYFYALLGVGAWASLRLSRQRAALLSGGLYALVSGLLVGLAGLSALAQGLGQSAAGAGS